jgi:hypothetical protein
MFLSSPEEDEQAVEWLALRVFRGRRRLLVWLETHDYRELSQDVDTDGSFPRVARSLAEVSARHGVSARLRADLEEIRAANLERIAAYLRNAQRAVVAAAVVLIALPADPTGLRARFGEQLQGTDGPPERLLGALPVGVTLDATSCGWPHSLALEAGTSLGSLPAGVFGASTSSADGPPAPGLLDGVAYQLGQRSDAPAALGERYAIEFEVWKDAGDQPVLGSWRGRVDGRPVAEGTISSSLSCVEFVLDCTHNARTVDARACNRPPS